MRLWECLSMTPTGVLGRLMPTQGVALGKGLVCMPATSRCDGERDGSAHQASRDEQPGLGDNPPEEGDRIAPGGRTPTDVEEHMTASDDVGLVVLDVVRHDADQETHPSDGQGGGDHRPRTNLVPERCARNGLPVD